VTGGRSVVSERALRTICSQAARQPASALITFLSPKPVPSFVRPPTRVPEAPVSRHFPIDGSRQHGGSPPFQGGAPPGWSTMPICRHVADVWRSLRPCSTLKGGVLRCSVGQQNFLDLQALYASPLTDSNRRPPPYHQAVATLGNSFGLIPAFSRLSDLPLIATGCNHGAP